MKNLPVTFQRLENLVIAIVIVVLFVKLHFDWWWLAVLFLGFDISAIGYLLNNKVGALTYNTVHSYILPSGLVLLYLATSTRWYVLVGLAEAFHIAVDRALGYGLKFPRGFQHTHLGEIGSA